MGPESNLALERWDALPYEVVIVGDSLRDEIQAGLELGALTVQVMWETTTQVAFDNAQLAEQVQADATVDQLAQLTALIEQWADGEAIINGES